MSHYFIHLKMATILKPGKKGYWGRSNRSHPMGWQRNDLHSLSLCYFISIKWGWSPKLLKALTFPWLPFCSIKYDSTNAVFRNQDSLSQPVCWSLLVLTDPVLMHSFVLFFFPQIFINYIGHTGHLASCCPPSGGRVKKRNS